MWIALRFGYLLVLCIGLGGAALLIALKTGYTIGLSSFGLLALTPLLQGNHRYGQPQLGYDLSLLTAFSFSSVSSLATIVATWILLGNALTHWGFLIPLMAINGLLGSWFARLFFRHLEHLPFPSAMAIVQATDSLALPSKAWPFFPSLGLSSLWTGLQTWWHAPVQWLPLGLPVGISLSPLLIGVGALVGIRTGLAFVLGALLSLGMCKPYGALEESLWIWGCSSFLLSMLGVEFLRHWAAVLYPWMRHRRGPLAIVAILAVAGSLVIPDWRFWGIALLLVLVPLLAYMNAFIAGKTDIVPLGSSGKLSILFHRLIFPAPWTFWGTLTAVGSAAATADFATDLKMGRHLGCHPRRQFHFQCLGSLLGPAVLVPLFLMFIVQQETHVGSDRFPVPAAQLWAAVYRMMDEPWAMLDPSFKGSLLVGAILGFLASFGNRLWKHTLSPTVIAMAPFLGTTGAFTLMLGGLWSAWTHRKNKKPSLYLWAGLLLGETLISGLSLLIVT